MPGSVCVFCYWDQLLQPCMSWAVSSIICLLRDKAVVSTLQWVRVSFGRCIVFKEPLLPSSFFRKRQQAQRPGGVDSCQEHLRNSFLTCRKLISSQEIEKSKHRVKCMRKYVVLPISYEADVNLFYRDRLIKGFLGDTAAAAAAKSLHSCPTLCDPIDGSPRGSPVPGILQARTPEWVAISFSSA